MILSTVSFANRTLFRLVGATYVGGSITTDTVWTLVDSPFVLSNNVTVYPDVTLTIEPGVEVRFGENFYIVVNGGIVADGTRDKMIRFTSNKLAPSEGDWGALLIGGTLSSSLTHCIVQYGTNGVMVENGALNILNSFVTFNSQNGITINGGNVVVQDNEITNNTISGICIAGGAQVTIQNNMLFSNGNGILLTGNLDGIIDIEQNDISLNRQSGIVLDAYTYYDTAIINNTISLNLNGFSVSGNTSTYITRNYILNNTIGVCYESGNDHEAQFNDIYYNDLGMDVHGTATVDATYNYWGHRSGPLHVSLNPHGKGNPVGGNGVNLRFIFFLSAPIDYNNTLPTASIWTDKILVRPDQNVTFVGADSYDDGRVDQYFFDFGDGTNSSWTTLSIVSHAYSFIGTYVASLRVIDDFNVTNAPAVTTVNVQYLSPLEALVALSNYTVNYDEEVLVTVYVSDGTMAVENANVTLFSVKGGSFTPRSGLTNSNGFFTATFTAPNFTETTDVRIIARASKTGYLDGSDYKYLKVIPPLMVQVDVDPATVKSEETATVTVHVMGNFEEPVAETLVLLSADYGNLSATIGITDSNGEAIFEFTAPQTLSQLYVTIAAIAMKTGYAGGQGQKTVIIEPKVLVVEVTADPSTVISEAVSTITAHVTFDAYPVSDVAVAVSSGSGGSFSATTEVTDSNGNAAFIFTAPQTTSIDGLDVTISVIAAKGGYLDGEGYATISVEPKVLVLQVAAEPNVTVSEARINVTVRVKYQTLPVEEANITLISEGFPTVAAITDFYGYAILNLTAPQVNEPINIALTARASKAGYADGENVTTITVNPGILSVEVNSDPCVVASRQSSVVTVYVTCNATSVANATVTMSSNYGNLSSTIGFTDSSGHCTFFFNAPRTTGQSSTVVITANATKNGYVSGANQTAITSTPETEGGWSITTLLLILIPVAIVIVVVVLIKLKVIALSFKEEG